MITTPKDFATKSKRRRTGLRPARDTKLGPALANLFAKSGPAPFPDNIIYGSFQGDSETPACNSDRTCTAGLVEDRVAEPPKVPGWKTGLDRGLILLSAPLWLPLMLLVMLVVRVTSPGPIFYRQQRIGRGGRRFLMWKFRTMKVSAETQSHERHLEDLIRNNKPLTKLDVLGDPRLIPLGRIIRASGLDELPQIFNVLRGEMSLVGPRPCLPNEFASYQQWQRKRVDALPGLTGYWQVNGKNRTTFYQMVAMDLTYVENMSISFDLKIILMTGGAVLSEILRSRG
jgi:exopolysaccharide production protein ExoY